MIFCRLINFAYLKLTSVMFEIPDDDNFWEELPLDDITNSGDKGLNAGLNVNVQSCTKPPCESNALNKQSVISTSKLPESCHPGSTRKRQRLDSGHNETNVTENNGKLNINSVNSKCPAVSPPVLVPDTQTSAVLKLHEGQVRQANVQTPCIGNARSHETPKRSKRKFPGPAGLLPKLQGLKQSPDLSEIVKSPSVHQEPQSNGVLTSSQSEDSFNELPWQTLIKDLGNDGQKYLKEFSIANSLQKSKKKLLPRGKVPFVMGVIETVDWQGSEASVVLKDKTGRVKGSIHGNIMKEYQEDLQVNSVLVLRQVGVISPTTRNHYLNITPSNIVSIYSNKTEGIRKVNCVDQPLYSIVESIQKDLDQELVNTMNRINSLPKTPNSCATGSVGPQRNCQTPNLNQSTPTNYRFKTPQRGVNPGLDPRVSENRSLALSSTPLRSPVPGTGYGSRSFTPRVTQHGCVPRTPIQGVNQQVSATRTPNPGINQQRFATRTPTPKVSQQGYINKTPTPGASQEKSAIRTPTPGVGHHINRTPASNGGQMGQFNRTSVSVCSTNSSVIQPCSSNSTTLIGTCTNTTVASPSQYRFNKSAVSSKIPPSEGPEVSSSDVAQSFYSASSTYSNENRLNTPLELSSVKNNVSHNQSIISNTNGQNTAPCMTTNSLSVTSTPMRNGFKFRSTKKSPNMDLAPSCSVSVPTTDSKSDKMDNSTGPLYNSKTVNLIIKNEFVNKPDSQKSFKPQPGVGQNIVDLHQSKSSHGNTDSMKNVPCFTVNSDWHDDLSDDLLSQLSEEME